MSQQIDVSWFLIIIGGLLVGVDNKLGLHVWAVNLWFRPSVAPVNHRHHFLYLTALLVVFVVNYLMGAM